MFTISVSGADCYGQDDGEVSWRIPLGRVNWAYPKQVPIHHWAWTALSGHRASHAGPLSASQVLALATVALLAAPDTVHAARDELISRSQGYRLTEPRIGAMETLSQKSRGFLGRDVGRVKLASWTSGGPGLDQGAGKSVNALAKVSTCSFHSTGNGSIAVLIVSPCGCRPATMASTISGASNVMRSTRLT